MRAPQPLLVAVLIAASACLDLEGAGGGARDLDRDGHVAAQDCDDRDPTVWWTQVAFRDADGDGRGAGAPDDVCSGDVLPYGWAHVSGDCDDTDPARWVIINAHADQDGDVVGSGAAVELCTGRGRGPRRRRGRARREGLHGRRAPVRLRGDRRRLRAR